MKVEMQPYLFAHKLLIAGVTGMANWENGIGARKIRVRDGDEVEEEKR